MANRLERGLKTPPRRGRLLVLATAALAMAMVASALALDFSSQSYRVGTGPEAIAVGDFDRDGVRDLAVANFADDPGLSILRGERDGSFRRAGGYEVNGNPAAVAVGRFGGGKDQDLAVATNGAVSVLIGKRRTKFRQAKFYGSYPGSQARGIATADFDDDGLADLAVSNDENGGQVSVLFGLGAGTFGAQQDFSTGDGMGEVATAKLNADDIPDVVTGGPVATDEVSVLLGKATSPYLEAAQGYPAGEQPRGIALGDFDRDGALDLAAANLIANAQNAITVSLLEGDGGGGFGPPQEIPVGKRGSTRALQVARRGVSGTTDVAATRLNRDRRLDLVVALPTQDSIAVRLGKPGLDFSQPQSFGAGHLPEFVAPGRFDRGPATDLAVTSGSSERIRVLLSR